MNGVARVPREEWPEARRRGYEFARDGHIVYDLREGADYRPIWYKVADEPDMDGKSPREIREKNALIKAQYPGLRTYVVIAGARLSAFRDYADCADLMAADVYLVTNTLFLWRPIEWVWAVVRIAAARSAWRGREWVGVYPAWTAWSGEGPIPNDHPTRLGLPPVKPWIMRFNRWLYRALGAPHVKAWCWEWGRGLL